MENVLRPVMAHNNRVIKQSLVESRYSLFMERYMDHFEMNIFILQIKGLSSFIRKQIENKSREQENMDGANNLDSMEGKVSLENTASSTSSATESSNLSSLLKQLQISMRSNIPRSLKIVLQLSLLMFLTIIIVSIVNLVLEQ